MVPGRKVDVVCCVAAAGRAHILGVEGVFEGKGDAIHGHGFQVWVGPVLGIQFRRPLQGVRKPAEVLAHRRRARWQWPLGGMTVVISLASNRPLPSDVEGGQRIDLAGLLPGDNHSVLLLYRRVGRGGLHAAELQGFAPVFVQVRENLRRCHRVRGKPDWFAAPNCAGGLGYGSAVLGDQYAGRPVIGPYPVNVTLYNFHAGRLAGLYGRMELCDGCFFQPEPVFSHGSTLNLSCSPIPFCSPINSLNYRHAWQRSPKCCCRAYPITTCSSSSMPPSR